jgi:hypothetical protein
MRHRWRTDVNRATCDELMLLLCMDREPNTASFNMGMLRRNKRERPRSVLSTPGRMNPTWKIQGS